MSQKPIVTTVAIHSRGVTAGLDARLRARRKPVTALEVMIDEVAASLPLDPALNSGGATPSKTGGRTITGNPYFVPVRTPEILDKLEKHPIWARRAEKIKRDTRNCGRDGVSRA